MTSVSRCCAPHHLVEGDVLRRIRQADDDAGVLLREEALRDQHVQHDRRAPRSRRTSISVGALVAQHEVQAARVELPAAGRSRARSQGRQRPCCTCFSSRRNSAHIIGDSVSATNAETAMVIVTVTANSRNSRPTMPPISSSGMNTATSEMLIERMVKPISPAPLSAASSGDRPVLDVAVDVLQHHDRIVDHEADRDGQRHQRQVVQAVADDVHQRRGAQQRQRHGDARE